MDGRGGLERREGDGQPGVFGRGQLAIGRPGLAARRSAAFKAERPALPCYSSPSTLSWAAAWPDRSAVGSVRAPVDGQRHTDAIAGRNRRLRSGGGQRAGRWGYQGGRIRPSSWPSVGMSVAIPGAVMLAVHG